MDNRQNRKKGTKLMAGGLLLIAAAFLLTLYNIWDDHRAGKEASAAAEELLLTAGSDSGEKEADPPDYVLNPDMEMPERVINGNEYIGVLNIPALDLYLPVMSGWSYEGLKTAPCRYAGSAYKDGFVIAGHNYRAHFSPLKDLETGEIVEFIDVRGNIFFYKVVQTETLAPTAVEEMVSDKWGLSLFTCTYSGQARLAVRCEAVRTKEAEEERAVEFMSQFSGF